MKEAQYQDKDGSALGIGFGTDGEDVTADGVGTCVSTVGFGIGSCVSVVKVGSDVGQAGVGNTLPCDDVVDSCVGPGPKIEG
ncbi:hypothetical protein FCV25MIE_05711 [Fagus crenata]